MGVPPSGKQVEFNTINIHYIRGGKFIKAESSFDMMSLMQQIGAIPTP